MHRESQFYSVRYQIRKINRHTAHATYKHYARLAWSP